MRIIVTCGPSYEPIDGARRMTNMSTGRLGVTLANFLTGAEGFAICHVGGFVQSCSDTPALCEKLHELLLSRIPVASRRVALNPA